MVMASTAGTIAGRACLRCATAVRPRARTTTTSSFNVGFAGSAGPTRGPVSGWTCMCTFVLAEFSVGPIGITEKEGKRDAGSSLFSGRSRPANSFQGSHAQRHNL